VKIFGTAKAKKTKLKEWIKSKGEPAASRKCEKVAWTVVVGRKKVNLWNSIQVGPLD
jgi:hypothetical protein